MLSKSGLVLLVAAYTARIYPLGEKAKRAHLQPHKGKHRAARYADRCHGAGVECPLVVVRRRWDLGLLGQQVRASLRSEGVFAVGLRVVVGAGRLEVYQ